MKTLPKEQPVHIKFNDSCYCYWCTAAIQIDSNFAKKIDFNSQLYTYNFVEEMKTLLSLHVHIELNCTVGTAIIVTTVMLAVAVTATAVLLAVAVSTMMLAYDVWCCFFLVILTLFQNSCLVITWTVTVFSTYAKLSNGSFPCHQINCL